MEVGGYWSSRQVLAAGREGRETGSGKDMDIMKKREINDGSLTFWHDIIDTFKLSRVAGVKKVVLKSLPGPERSVLQFPCVLPAWPKPQPKK